MPKPNWGSGATGALSGGATGFSMGGPIGGAIGGIAGGLAGLFGGGKKKKAKKGKPISTLDPTQMSLYEDYVKSLRGNGPFSDSFQFDSKGYNDVFDKTVSRPAYRNFQENIIPGITGQFRSGGLMNSSYAGDALSRAGRDVQENLDSQRSQNIFQGQQQANQNRNNGINSILNLQTMAYDKPAAQNPSSIDQILGKLAPAMGDFLGDFLKKKISGGSSPSPTV